MSLRCTRFGECDQCGLPTTSYTRFRTEALTTKCVCKDCKHKLLQTLELSMDDMPNWTYVSLNAQGQWHLSSMWANFVSDYQKLHKSWKQVGFIRLPLAKLSIRLQQSLCGAQNWGGMTERDVEEYSKKKRHTVYLAFRECPTVKKLELAPDQELTPGVLLFLIEEQRTKLNVTKHTPFLLSKSKRKSIRYALPYTHALIHLCEPKLERLTYLIRKAVMRERGDEHILWNPTPTYLTSLLKRGKRNRNMSTQDEVFLQNLKKKRMDDMQEAYATQRILGL